MHPDTDPLHAYARRARLERTLYLAECIASAIFAAHRFVQGAVSKVFAPREAKRAPVPATQR